MRRAAALALVLLLPGCAAALVPAAAGIGAVGGSLAIADESLRIFGDSLTDAAKIACAVQAYANQHGNADLSTAVGAYCKW